LQLTAAADRTYLFLLPQLAN